MSGASTAALRPAAVAGFFYPGDAERLAQEVDRLLAAAGAWAGPAPKALVAPHAGYIYSGPIAAAAYARLAPAGEAIRRVVLLGPSHRVAFRGLALPSVAAFATPLGPVPLDRAAIDAVAGLPGVERRDDAHAREHSLEVHLPFLQRTLGDFALVPVVVGQAPAAHVAGLLAALWGGPETLIVVSTDLSHYLDDAAARARDGTTAAAIEALAPDRIGPEDACGAHPLAGLLTEARRLGLAAERVSLRNSGHTAGDKSRVVGYGAWAFGPERDSASLGEDERGTLLGVAARSIEHGLAHGKPLAVAADGFAPVLRDPGACFVTLTAGGQLRGCIGSLEPHRPLCADAAWNAHAAAFHDDRFDGLRAAELGGLAIEISVLGRPVEMPVADEADLLAQLRPGLDGLILRTGGQRATLLPAVWEHGLKPAEFVAALKQKAGLKRKAWPADTRIWRYGTESFAAPLAALG